jgi:hypothetical protein
MTPHYRSLEVHARHVGGQARWSRTQSIGPHTAILTQRLYVESTTPRSPSTSGPSMSA